MSVPPTSSPAGARPRDRPAHRPHRPAAPAVPAPRPTAPRAPTAPSPGQYPPPTVASPRPRSRRGPSLLPRRRSLAAAAPAPSSACCPSGSRSSASAWARPSTAPSSFPGSAATLAFLLALTGVSLVVLALGISGRASGFSGVLVVCSASCCSPRRPHRASRSTDGVGDRTWTPVPDRPARTTSSSERATPPSTSAGSTPTAPRPSRRRSTVEMGAGEPHDPRPRGLDAGSTRTSASATSASGRHRHRRRQSAGRTVHLDHFGDSPVEVVIDAQLGLGRDHHPGAVMSTPPTPPARHPRRRGLRRARRTPPDTSRP